MLKTTRSFDKPASNKNNGSKLAFSKNDNSRPASEKNNGNGEINRFGVGRNDIEYAKKSEKLSKLRKLKSKKRLNLKIWLSQEESCQKVEIYLILTLQGREQSS